MIGKEEKEEVKDAVEDEPKVPKEDTSQEDEESFDQEESEDEQDESGMKSFILSFNISLFFLKNMLITILAFYLFLSNYIF